MKRRMKIAFDGTGHVLIHFIFSVDNKLQLFLSVFQSGEQPLSIIYLVDAGISTQTFSPHLQDIESCFSWLRDFFQPRFVSCQVCECSLERC